MREYGSASCFIDRKSVFLTIVQSRNLVMKIAALLLFQPQCHSCADACIVDICSYVQNSQRVPAYMLSRCLSIDASRSPFVTIFFPFFRIASFFAF